MKAHLVKDEPEFRPMTLTVTLESQDDVDTFARIMVSTRTRNRAHYARVHTKYANVIRQNFEMADALLGLITQEVSGEF